MPARAQGPQLPPEESFVRTAHAARRTGGPIVVDGRMDEPAWQAAPLEDDFTQVSPDEGKPASVHTAFRMLWDDEYLYFGAICDDAEPPTATLSRRDRFIEGDSVQFDLDTTLDRRTAYHFQVYAAGQQLDAIHFNDTDMTTDWDAPWDSAVAKTKTGWAVEMRIPLRSLRIPVGVKLMGFNVYRILSRRHEEDQWRYRPNGRPGDISRLGLLAGIEGIHPVRALELRPYVGMKYVRNSPTPARGHSELGSCATTPFDADRTGGACAGLDLRYNLASDLALVGTINPDFGQVEADQRVLNLSTFETFFPEKRPFFLEGLDLFKLPLRTDIGGPYGGDAYQIFYSRRIGRGTPTHDDLGLADDRSIVYQQPSVPVLGAAKLSGTVGGASVGLLTAVEPQVNAQVLEPSGRIDDLRTVEARSDSVLRVRAPLGDSGTFGVTGTAVDPFLTDPAAGLDRRHAHVGEGDLILYSKDRTWDFTAQGAGSLLTGVTPEVLRDGTERGPTSSGGSASGRIHYLGEHFGAALNTDYLSPQFTTNDLGFMPRANLFRTMGYMLVRDPHPNDKWQSWQLILGGREVRDAPLRNRLGRDGFFEGWINTKSFWFFDSGVDFFAPAVDDRELADGTPIERQSTGTWYGYISTDSRKPLQVQFYWTEARSWPRFERQNQLGTTLVFRPLPQLDGQLDLSYNENAGTIRQIPHRRAVAGRGRSDGDLRHLGGAAARAALHPRPAAGAERERDVAGDVLVHTLPHAAGVRAALHRRHCVRRAAAGGGRPGAAHGRARQPAPRAPRGPGAERRRSPGGRQREPDPALGVADRLGAVPRLRAPERERPDAALARARLPRRPRRARPGGREPWRHDPAQGRSALGAVAAFRGVHGTGWRMRSAPPPRWFDLDPQVGSPQHGSPQQGSPQHGSPQQGSPQQGSPQQGSPQHGSPQQSGSAAQHASSACCDTPPSAAIGATHCWFTSPHPARASAATKERAASRLMEQ